MSGFDSKSLIILTGATQSFTLSATTNTGLLQTINYAITVTGGTGTSLITLSGDTVTFASTNVLAYAGVYTISVKAQING